MKIFHHIFKKVSSKKGYTLLFAVIVSVLLLSIAAFILSVSRKQAILSSSARDSIYAFYAADSGLECAVENLATLGDFITGDGETISCGNNTINVSQENSGGAISAGDIAYGTSTFVMPTGVGADPSMLNNTASPFTQSGAASCASTTVTYYYNPDSSITAITVVTSGYNIGWNGTDCSVTGPRKVERTLRYSI